MTPVWELTAHFTDIGQALALSFLQWTPPLLIINPTTIITQSDDQAVQIEEGNEKQPGGPHSCHMVQFDPHAGVPKAGVLLQGWRHVSQPLHHGDVGLTYSIF